MASLGGTLFMFLVGLEIDFQFLTRSIRSASFITIGNTVTSTVIASIVGPIIYNTIGINGGRFFFVFILIIILANSASPVVIHMMAELKVTMSDLGRLGISAALIIDITCLVIIGIVILFPNPNTEKMPGNKFIESMAAVVLIIVSAGIFRVVVKLIDRTNGAIKDKSVWFLVFMVIAVVMVSDALGYPSIMAAFLIGLAFPRDGATTRTIVKGLTFWVNNLVLPIYFGYAGVQVDLFKLREKTVILAVAVIVILGTIAKVLGTIAVAKRLKMQVKEGVVLGLLLNIKGHVQLTIKIDTKVYC